MEYAPIEPGDHPHGSIVDRTPRLDPEGRLIKCVYADGCIRITAKPIPPEFQLAALGAVIATSPFLFIPEAGEVFAFVTERSIEERLA